MNTQAIDKVAMQELTIEYRTGVESVSVTGLVADERTPWTWFESVRFVGYGCDEEECPDDPYEDCHLHPGDEYWRDQMRLNWLENIRDRGMRPVVDPDLVKAELGLNK